MAPTAEPAKGKADVPPPTIVTESNLADGTQETVVGSPAGRFSSRSGGGAQTQDYDGQPTQNEDNVADALHRLRDKLNHDAGSRLWQERPSHEDASIDGTLSRPTVES